MHCRSPVHRYWVVVIPIIMAALSPPGEVRAAAQGPAVFAAASATPGSLLIALPNTCAIDVWLADIRVLKAPTFLTNVRVTAFSPFVEGGKTGSIQIDFDTPARATTPPPEDIVVEAVLKIDGVSQSYQKSIPIDMKTPSTPDQCVAAVQYEPGHSRVVGDAAMTAAPELRQGELPSTVQLGDAFPNPLATNRLTIPFGLPAPGRVALRVYDVAGRLIRTVDESDYPAGQFSLSWDVRDDHGTHVASGLYFYTLTVDGRTHRKSVAVVK